MNHLCYAIDGAFIGGGHLHALGLARAAREAGHPVSFLCSAKGPFTELLSAEKFAVNIVPMGKFFSFAIKRKWVDVVEHLKPDVLHLHGGVAGFWGRWSCRKLPLKIIYTLHGIHFIHNDNILVRYVSWLMERFVANPKDTIICVCESDARLAQKLKIAVAGQIHVIYNGVDLRHGKSVKTKTSSGFVIGILGRLVKMKGQEFALLALKLLQNKIPEAELILAGSGPDQAKLKRLAETLGISGKVKFVGAVPPAATAALLNGFDAILLPSLWEGQPLVLLEAMREGVPIVASAVDGIPEVVRDNVEALLVPPRDVAQLARAIAMLYKDASLRERLRRAAFERVQAFDEKECFKKTIALY